MIVCPFNDLKRYAPILPGLEEAVEAALKITDWSCGNVQLSGGNKILVQETDSKTPEGQLCEIHRNYLDIQYIVEGVEVVGWAHLSTLTPADEFDTVKDKGMCSGDVEYFRIPAGYCYVAFPEDGHMPNLHLDQPSHIKKLVLKLKLV